MSIPTVAVTAVFTGQDGEPIQGIEVYVKLLTLEKYDGFIVPQMYEGVTDETGTVVLNLFPNELGSEGSEYRIQYVDKENNRQEKFTAVIPNLDCNLWDVVDLRPYSKEYVGAEFSVAVFEARDEAVEAADTATNASSSAAITLNLTKIARDAAQEAQAEAEEASNSTSGTLNLAMQAKIEAEAARDISVTKAGEASNSAYNAATSEGNASASEANALSYKDTAESAKDTAVTKAGEASTSASNAATSEGNALSYKNAAETAKTDAEAALSEFESKYLGSFASDPTTNNDGGALVEGMFYWNTTDKKIKIYNGLSWEYPVTSDAATVGNYTAEDLAKASYNAIINPLDEFNTIDQRDSGAVTTYDYFADRWIHVLNGAGSSIDKTGQWDGAASGYTGVSQRIENVAVHAGKTLILSFDVSGATLAGNLGVSIRQNFGTGGSTQVDTWIGLIPITTIDGRYKITVPVPSVAGKTIGDNSFLEPFIWKNDSGTYLTSIGGSNPDYTGSLKINNIKLGYNDIYVPVDPATELVKCKRFFERIKGGAAYSQFAEGHSTGSGAVVVGLRCKKSKREECTFSLSSTTHFSIQEGGGVLKNLYSDFGTILLDQNSFDGGRLYAYGGSGLTEGFGVRLIANNTTDAHIDFSAEL